jgi:hypothetical protein
MAPLKLDKLIEQVDMLSPEDQLQLIAHLAEKIRQTYLLRLQATEREPVQPRRRWREICGVAPYPLLEEDAQSWVSRTRRESDENRLDSRSCSKIF